MIHLRMLTPAMLTDHEVAGLCNNIWPKPYADAASHATIYDGLHNPTGQIFVICYTERNHTAVVGITGYFYDNGHCYLRWTGVAPNYRKHGVFRTALELLTLQLKGANPSVQRIIELVPANEYGDSIERAFLNVGFVPTPEGSLIPEGEDSDWPVVPYSLHF